MKKRISPLENEYGKKTTFLKEKSRLCLTDERDGTREMEKIKFSGEC